MSVDKFEPFSSANGASSQGAAADFRSRALQRKAEDDHRRQQDLVAQASLLNPPGERILIWERVHAVPLPRSPDHKLMQVIATQTNLALEQVLEEQRRRAESAISTID